MGRPLTLIIDLDSIIVDLLGPWLGWYNELYDDKLTVADLTSYAIEKHVKPGCHYSIYDFFTPVDRYAECPILPGASEALAAFRDMGHDIVIATATAGQTAHQKWVLAKKAAPWLPASHIMVGSRKELLRGDVFIDDAPKNVVKYKQAWPEAKAMTIAYPYNAEIYDWYDLRAEGWQNPAGAWSQIVDAIKEIP